MSLRKDENHYFYCFGIVFPPAFEKITLREIHTILDDLADGVQWQLKKSNPGTFELFAPLEIGLQLNLYLRTATRIYLRLTSFKARDFPKLFKRIAQKKWSCFHCQPARCEINVTCKKSRLSMKKKIAKTFVDGMIRGTAGPADEKIDTQQEFLIRLEDDLCTISADSSGEALYKRSYKTATVAAPLRENFSAAILELLFEQLSADGIKNFHLHDPFLGSGTFLAESFFSGQNFKNDKRRYAFENWQLDILKNDFPGVESGEFVEQGENLALLSKKENQILRHSHRKDLKIIARSGSDISPANLAIAQNNFMQMTNFAALRGHEPITFLKNALDLRDEDFPGNETVVFITNPPYGQRLKLKNPHLFYQQILSQWRAIKNLQYVAIIHPFSHEKWVNRAMWDKKLALPFLNGGTKVSILVLKKKQ